MTAPQLRLVINGRLNEALRAMEDAQARATTQIIRNKGRQLQRNLRKDVRNAGLGSLEKAVRLSLFPRRGSSLNAAHEVFSKAIVRRSGRRIDLLTVYDEGATIRAGAGSFLVIPVGVPGSTRRRRQLTPQDFPEGTFDRIPTRTGFLLRFRRTGRAAFILVNSQNPITIDPSLRILTTTNRVYANTAELLARRADRLTQQAFDKVARKPPVIIGG